MPNAIAAHASAIYRGMGVMPRSYFSTVTAEQPKARAAPTLESRSRLRHAVRDSGGISFPVTFKAGCRPPRAEMRARSNAGHLKSSSLTTPTMHKCLHIVKRKAYILPMLNSYEPIELRRSHA